MIKTYTPDLFFAEIPASLILEYFEKQGKPFDGPENPIAQQLLGFWKGLEKEIRNDMEADFRDVYEFISLPHSVESIYQEAGFRKEHPKEFPDFVRDADTFNSTLDALGTVEEKAFWTLSNHRDVFDNAFRFSVADKKSTQRFTTKRPTGHFDKPKDQPEDAERLGASISGYYQTVLKKPDGYEIQILDREGVIYYFLYIEDVARSAVIFKKGKRTRQVQPASFQIFFAFNPENGELTSCVPGGREIREALERRFGEICLDDPDLLPLPKKSIYNLEKFKDTKALLNVNLADGFSKVRVKSIKLYSPISEHYISIDSKSKDEDARHLLEKLFLQNQTGYQTFSEFKVANVEIEMLQSRQGRRADKVAFELSSNNRCNLNDSPEHRIAKTYLTQWGIESGGPQDIVRQLLASLEQNQFIQHFQTREWPEYVLDGLMEQGILRKDVSATAVPCPECAESCEVRYRTGGINTPYFTCSNCRCNGSLKEEEISQYKVFQDGITALISKGLDVPKKVMELKDHLWDLGAYPKGEPGDRIFLLNGNALDAEMIKTTLENEAGICLGLDFEKPAWLPSRLCFISLRREVSLDGKSLRIDAVHIHAVYSRHLKNFNPEPPDEFQNPRPVKLALPGNVAQKDRDLRIIWRKYLGKYSPKVQVYLFEKETTQLDWKQAQRARFVFPGKEEGAVSQYNRHLQKLKLSALSGNPTPEGGWFKNENIYKQLRIRADSSE